MNICTVKWWKFMKKRKIPQKPVNLFVQKLGWVSGPRIFF